MRNPWTDELARAPEHCHSCKPGFSIRTAVMIAIGNAVMMTAAHALAGGFGRVLGATCEPPCERLESRSPPTWNWPIAPQEIAPIQIQFELVPAWVEPFGVPAVLHDHAATTRATRVTSRFHAGTPSIRERHAPMRTDVLERMDLPVPRVQSDPANGIELHTLENPGFDVVTSTDAVPHAFYVARP